MGAILVASVSIIPLIVTPQSTDSFRFPKELGIRLTAIILLGLLAIGAIFRRPFRRRLPSLRVQILTAAIVVWVIIAAAASTNPWLSLTSVARTASVALVFICTYMFCDSWHVRALVGPVAAALINAALIILQELEVWNPFTFEYFAVGHAQSTALLGNPNDVGSFLVAPALTALTVSLVTTRRRVIWGATSTLLIAGIVVSLSMTALFSLLVASAILMWLRFRRYRPLSITAALALAVSFLFYPPIHRRASEMLANLTEKRVDFVISGRSAAFASAWAMAMDHPLTGVGPHRFRWHYFPYKLAAEEKQPQLLDSTTRGLNFGEVHSDHLQILAETGVPGYLLFACALVVLGMRSRGLLAGHADHEQPDTRRIGEHLSLPLAASLAVLALTQFPLQLAAPTMTYTFLAGLCIAWTDGVRP